MPAPTSDRDRTLINLFNPQLIVLGAACSRRAPTASPYAPVDERVVLEGSRRGLRIVAPALGDDVGLIGAVEFARLRARHARKA